MATEKVDILQVNTEPSRTSVKDLRKELKSLKDEMLNLDEGTAEYNATLSKAANIQHTLKEQMEFVNASAMDAGQMLGNATNAVAGMTGAFQAGVGVMNMFGVESEASMKAIQQMQNVMAITQGFQAIDEGIDAFKKMGTAIKSSALFQKLFTKSKVQDTAATVAHTTAVGGETVATEAGTAASWSFNASLLANPIMWLVVGIAALVAGLAYFILRTSEADKAQMKLNESMEAAVGEQEHQINLLKAKGATEEEIYKAEYKNYQNKLKLAKGELALLDKDSDEYKQKLAQIVELNRAQEVANEDYLTGVENKNNAEVEKEKQKNEKLAAERQKKKDDDLAIIKAAEEELKNKRQTDLQNALDDENEKYEKEKAAYIRQKKDITELTKQHEKDIQKIKDDAATAAKAKDEADAAAEKDKLKKKSENILKGYDEQVAATELGEQKMLASRLESLVKGDLTQKQFDALNKQDADNKLNDEIENLTALLDNEQLVGEERAKVEEKLAGKKIELSQKVLAKKKADTDAEIALEKEKAASMMKIAGALSGALAGAADLAEEGSKEQKALKISSAIIDGLLGGIAAYTGMIETIPGPGGIVAGVLAAGTVAMSVAASIKKMKAVPVGKGGGGGPSMPSISLAGLAASQAPVQATTQVTGASTEAAMQDTRVYVVESDITNTQRKVGTAEAEATF